MSEPAVISEDRIRILCPGGLVSGGAELLHQLAGSLRARGLDAAIVYTPLGSTFTTPVEYGRYQCEVAHTVPDEKGVAVIAPEVGTLELARFKHACHVVWWLSVDNYSGRLGTPAGWKMIVRRWLFSDIPRPETTVHLFQSEYARDFVRKRFGAGGEMLSDYLAAEYLQAPIQGVRRPAVAYNPRKGQAFTRQLMQACPGVKFVPLENMTRDQLRATLDTCMVYVDFGHHPGKDRIPREAAVRGAVVIVGRTGSAAVMQDVPLPERYKFAPRADSLPALRGLIEEVFLNFDEHARAQQPYRNAIAAEPAAFESQLDRVFGRGTANRP